MDLEVGSLHTLAATVSVVLGLLGPLLALVYAARVDRRDFWRPWMIVGATLTFVSVLAAYLSGQQLVKDRPGLLNNPEILPHIAYADRMRIPVSLFFALAVLTGLLHPRTGVLRLVLPLLLVGFAVITLGLVVLSNDSGARQLLDTLLDNFR